MASNVEIKAKISDLNAFKNLALTISDGPAVILKQVDTYYKVQSGRLKLRQIQDHGAELIFYNRPDSEGPKLSSYSKQEFGNPNEVEGLKAVLASSLGIVGEVKKTRFLFMCGQTRIHVDEVQDLGYFMELEVVLKIGDTLEFGQKIADDLMSKLGIKQDDLISGSYINLLKST